MRKIVLLCAMTAALSLSACGGGSSSGSEVVTPPAGTTFVDGFITFVTNLVSTAPDDIPAREIDSIGTTSPEDTAAAPVK
ncbi:hypothetical protein [Actimicrobium sp. CCI2.3]|uniref:hypothetical protein n=1 Tax=Actimicrobium sp. CCI2.3 TaxID=3048616 RepID=UPI002AB36D0F|nr:hypothetical protein [Actimicrobium sp. CCI2.3]MDY7572762.1 hypothetical protein [Actimicrobium sp. CCI2.3]MEB0022282.1 hypothetical protein [Actimicrobium sp. CCI2.3]